MRLLRWIGGITVLFWALGLIFRIGGNIIHLLLALAAIVLIVDLSIERGRRKKT